MADLDFYDDTRQIRTWIAHGAVSCDLLVAELTEWADFFSSQVPDEDHEVEGAALLDGPVAENGAL